ncbi:GNAT family N-acetyltransferase [Clostridium omnivorum]|uniref:N-acetyltransferase n=1 Tax=Clostridium omnivorum TaxID=1604902 RepID=A0ABQ5N1K1_9CLOT|nr:GNAT family N-acetyltransferase [Clostridium sp. E14]GLC29067.1 putative N-acetyltransferase [Clostridium sp. E14]
MNIRNMKIEDYYEVYQLWQKCGISLGKSDSKEEIQKFIFMNPETSMVGTIDNKIIGCVLGGYDGRRGLIHHLAVHPDYQGNDYGTILMECLENKFKENGVVKVSFWVQNSNIGVVDFYEKLGYELRKDIVTISKVL